MAKRLPTLPPSPVNPFGRPSRRHSRRDIHRSAFSSLRQFWQALRTRLPRVNIARLTLGIATVLILSALLSLHLIPDKVSLQSGQPGKQEIRASRTVRFVDEQATDEMREQAAARVEPIYKSAPYAASDAAHAVTETYALLRKERLLGNQNPERASLELRQQVGIVVALPSILAPLLRATASPYHLGQAEHITEQAIHDVMGGAMIRSDRPDNLTAARDAVAQKIASSMLPREDVAAVAALARAIVQPNFQLDERATERARDAQRQSVSPVTSQIFAGDIVVRRGETVTAATIDKLRALGLENPRLDPGTVVSVMLLTALIVGLVVMYLSRYQRAVYDSTKSLLLLSVLVILSVLSLRLGGSMLGVRLSEAQFGYVGILCIAASAMLVAALIHPRTALVVTALLAALSGLILANDLRFSLMTLLSGIVGIYAVSDIRSRSDVVRAGAALCATNVLLSVVLARIEGDAPSGISQAILWALLAGVLSVALFSVGAALFERLFGITTHLSLLELSDPNRPLLQRFCQVAPGTYTHSVMVGNLAVVAAEAIGADTLLCRVGAYYHDLGKMKRAEFFVENQANGANIHERLNPSLSALVVTAHVKDGLEIADQERLPPIIKDFITEHHGTSLIKYFYHQQTSGNPGGTPGLEQHFRYGGPKPQSRETAILMLSDGVEAASRTLEKPTAGRIADLVDNIIGAQLADGQLDECDLTLRDLRGIRDAFLRLLSGMLHSRIEYPELLKDSARESKSDKHEPPHLPTNDGVPVPVILSHGGEAGGKSSDSAAA